MNRLTPTRSNAPQHLDLPATPFRTLREFETALHAVCNPPQPQLAADLHKLLGRLPELELADRVEAAMKLAGQTTAISHDEQLTLLGSIIDLVEQSVANESAAYRESAGFMLEWTIFDAMQGTHAPNANFYAIHSQLLKMADRYQQPDFSALLASQMTRRLGITPPAHREQDYKTLTGMIAEFRPEFRSLMFGALLKKLPDDPSERLRVLELLDAQTPLLEIQTTDTMEIQAQISQQLYVLRLREASLQQDS